MELEKVLVAVKAEKVISKTALAWALSHVVHPGDCIRLLAVFSVEKTGRKLWSFPRFSGDCGSSKREKLPDQIYEISESFSQMVLQFQDQIEVRVRIKVVSGTPGNAVAAEAKSNGATWVILDKKLKQELKYCMEELHCNIVVMNGSQPKVLRLNLGCSSDLQTPFFSASSSPDMDVQKSADYRMKHCTPVSSPEEPSTSYTRTTRENSVSSSTDTISSLFLLYDQNPLFEGLNKRNYSSIDEPNETDELLTAIDFNGERFITLTKTPSSLSRIDKSVYWIPQNHIAEEKALTNRNNRNKHKIKPPTSRALYDKFVEYGQDTRNRRFGLNVDQQKDYLINSNIRDAVSLHRTSSAPPPLCSICQHKAPVFGKPPKRFSYRELEEATDGFSDMNFLAEGGFGVVHKGVLRDGEVVAVKQLKFEGSQGDADFSREVRVLSCAQHRNVVLLIGYCVEGKKRVLVFEYICNGSLDSHLYGKNGYPLHWNSRLKIAIGAARGLRYLHEDCRVGCIVHRDMRPNNILLTHDFEPMVGDFGLARWHSEWDMITEERVIGTSGYLAPEYFDGGIITEKVDVYAFGMVLLELMTGRRTSELQLYNGQHLLSDIFHPLATLQSKHVLANHYQFLDPYLASNNQQPEFTHEIQAMGRAASLCLCRDPDFRPSMSKVLRILETCDPIMPIGLDLDSSGSRSGRLSSLTTRPRLEPRLSHSRQLSH